MTNEEKLNPAYKKQNYNINEVIVLDSTQTKDYLFDKAQKFIALNFKNSQRVIQLSDRISGSIICKGTMKTYIKGLLGYTSPGYMHYTLSVSVKNGKYKVEVNQVEYAATSPSCIGLSNFQIENSKSPCGLWEADWEYVKENYLIEMNSFLEYFKKEMARPANEDW